EIPQGGLFIWLKVKPEFKTPKLFEKALSKGIVLNPGSIYAETSGQFIRISYGCASMEEIRKGIYELGKLLKDIK
ncbi:PLP-dependent aminotransferase family protein, partial [Virgibacillus halodenitrificans]|nr:PLP-dependent aminotransferase family protein [Virgibacillus halodenitrificans]